METQLPEPTMMNKKFGSETSLSLQKKSAEAALRDMKDDDIYHIEKREFIVGIFLHFNKAFDTIKHKIWLDKFALSGITGVALDLINSYSMSCYESTFLNGKRICLHEYVVPERSIISPLVCLILVNYTLSTELIPKVVICV